jgi:hypothetical protein
MTIFTLTGKTEEKNNSERCNKKSRKMQEMVSRHTRDCRRDFRDSGANQRFHRIQDTIDKGRRLFTAIPFGNFNRLVDRNLIRHILTVQNLKHSDAQKIPVGYCDSLQAPVFRTLTYQAVDMVSVMQDSVHKIQGIGPRLPVHLVEVAEQVKPLTDIVSIAIIDGEIILKKKLQGGLSGLSTYSHKIIYKKIQTKTGLPEAVSLSSQQPHQHH